MHYARRSRIDPVQFINNIVEYQGRSWSHNPLHPKHLYEYEKEIKLLRKKLKKLRTVRRRQYYLQKIKELKDGAKADVR